MSPTASRRAEIWRDDAGVPHIEGKTEAEIYWGMGYVHARDRGLQVVMMRILGQGRASELLDSSEETLGVDKFFRRMNWRGGAAAELERLTKSDRKLFEAYCEGINDGLREKFPWELRLMGVGFEPWKLEDSVMLIRMISYLTLAQSQEEMERLIVEMVQAGVTAEKLKELFPGSLGGLDAELIKKVKLAERIVPAEVVWNVALPRVMASNNWVVSGAKTASGKAILSNDPHLEINRLPNVWSEMVLRCGERWALGVTMPGLPGLLIGRNPDLAWGATYTFMDAIDSWVEDCRDGKFRRGEQWQPFEARTETILRKKKDPVEITYYENDHGVLNGDPTEAGYYLATQWSSSRGGGGSLSAIFKMWDAATVTEGMDLLGDVETAFNWVFSDSEGNIGYQMSGVYPLRREGVSGLIPLPGWDAENDWKGFAAAEDLPKSYNPPEGYFVTANNDLNRYGKVDPINLPMGPYRANRIDQLLAEGSDFTMGDMQEMHYDARSLEGEAFMKVLRPLLPDTPQADILRTWDFQYTPDSKGAYLFERFYREIYSDVFGRKGFGEKVTDYLFDETGTFIDFYQNFDDILLAEESAWFGGETREEIFRRAAEIALQSEPKTWGETQKVMMSHMLFGGQLPRWLGFDRGPITVRGGRATIHQGQIYRSAGRTTSFAASYRMVVDFAEDGAKTNICGGPSDRRFSPWYCSDLENWQTQTYKLLSANGSETKSKFP